MVLRTCTPAARPREGPLAPASRVEVSKSHRRRVIPMTDALHASLAQRALARRKRRRPDDLVFATVDGSSLAHATVRMHLKRAVEACEAIEPQKKPKVTMHTLRHTAASLMVAGGRPIFDVAKILGHQDVKTTMRYAHFAPEAGRDTIEALGRMLDLGAEVTGDGGDVVSDVVSRFG